MIIFTVVLQFPDASKTYALLIMAFQNISNFPCSFKLAFLKSKIDFLSFKHNFFPFLRHQLIFILHENYFFYISLKHTFKYLCSVTISFLDTIDGADKPRKWIICEVHTDLMHAD